MSTPRHRSREIALQALFGLDADPEQDADLALGAFFRHFAAEAGGEPEPAADDRAFTEALVRGVWSERAALDEALGKVSRNWRVDRMARVDRSVMRLALYELLHTPDVPVAVVLDEAIELAKRFGAEDASAFVNGMLDRAVTELGIARAREA